MKEIKIIPRYWIVIEDNWIIKQLELWVSKNLILILLWEPLFIKEWILTQEDCYYYENNSLQLTFSKDNKLLYIEINYDLEEIYIDNFKIFKIEVDELLDKLSKNYWNYIEDYKWTSYIFNDFDISFGRPCKPDESEEELWENDYQKWIYFSYAGVWLAWYYSGNL